MLVVLREEEERAENKARGRSSRRVSSKEGFGVSSCNGLAPMSGSRGGRGPCLGGR